MLGSHRHATWQQRSHTPPCKSRLHLARIPSWRRRANCRSHDANGGINPSPNASDDSGSGPRLTQPLPYIDRNPIASGGASGSSPAAAPQLQPPSPSATAAAPPHQPGGLTGSEPPAHRERRRHSSDDLLAGEAPEELGALSRQGAPIWPRGNLTAVILGGGEADSRRLFPLTQYRTLPAIPFGGSYRLIDLLMSNLINSGVNKVAIMTAYNSYSLNRHLQRTYDMSGGVPFGGDGYIEVVANTMSPDNPQWFTGTAGCVRHFMSYFDSNSKNRFIGDVLILPGDHAYVTDLTPIISYHHATGADLTVVCRPVSGEQATRLGVVKLDSDMRISAFREKPPWDQLAEFSMSDDEMRPFLLSGQQHYNGSGSGNGNGAARQGGRQSGRWGAQVGGRRGGSGGGSSSGEEEAEELVTARALWAAQGHARVGGGAGGRVVLDTMTSSGDEVELSPGSPGFVGSTGIYIFRRSVLADVLKRYYKAQDFGRHIIPEIIREGYRVHAYRLPGYWADVGGSVGDFYSANMALLGERPSIDFDAPVERPLFRYPLTIPATQLQGARVAGCLVSSGCIIREATIRNSVVGPRNIIGSGVVVTDSVLMGADHYEHEKPQRRPLSPTYPPMGIGEGSVLRGAIVDLNCRIGRGVQLVNREGVYESYDRASQGLYVRDGVIVLAREAVVPDGTVM